jgi:hypothetical protein
VVKEDGGGLMVAVSMASSREIARWKVRTEAQNFHRFSFVD